MEFQIKNKIICFTAKRNSGKSQLLRYMVNCSRSEFHKIFVICPTETVNHFYKDLVPKQNIFSQYKEEWVEKLIDKMTELNSGKNDNEAKHILLILDDYKARKLAVLYKLNFSGTIGVLIAAKKLGYINFNYDGLIIKLSPINETIEWKKIFYGKYKKEKHLIDLKNASY